jgi:hypothetical protein
VESVEKRSLGHFPSVLGQVMITMSECDEYLRYK